MNTITKLKVLVLAALALSVIHCSKGGGGSSSSSPACPANTIGTAAGCLPQCGSGMVYYQNSCIPASQVTGYGYSGMPGSTTLPGSCPAGTIWSNNTCVPLQGGGMGGMPGSQVPGGAQNICSGRCGPGMVETYNGCLPAGVGGCGACYGYANGWCYVGVNAEYYCSYNRCF